MPPSLQDALTAFESSAVPGVWPYITKADLLSDLRVTVNDPLNVNQGFTPLCGPAAVVYELVRRDPVFFVQICQQLFETGQFAARTGRIVQPSDTLRNSRVRTGITTVDWMVMATVRDSENLLFHVDADAPDFVTGISNPWEVKGWTAELLGYHNVSFQPILFYGECEALQRAQTIRDQGGVAFLLINVALLGSPKPAIPIPDHWIDFLGNLQIDPEVWDRRRIGQIHFDCYTWGGIRHLDINEKTFEACFFGMVTGRPS